MKVKQPKVVITGDNETQDMARHGGIVGFSYFHVVWVFGFLPDSEYAKTYGVSTSERTYVISDFDGQIKDTYTGPVEQLSPKFLKIINFQFWFAKGVDPQILKQTELI